MTSSTVLRSCSTWVCEFKLVPVLQRDAEDECCITKPLSLKCIVRRRSVTVDVSAGQKVRRSGFHT
jgi:hypothetical protein